MSAELIAIDETHRGADISECGRYRYSLFRQWRERTIATLPPVVFVMLNPSTADAEVDDPTIRRCIGFAKREMAGAVFVMNLFALRATDPSELAKCADPVGPKNDEELKRLLGDGYATVICAWGANDFAKARAKKFVEMMSDRTLYCLGLTKAGAPKHPLYVRSDAPLIPYRMVAPHPAPDNAQASGETNGR